jgi:hypothetical protein
MNYDLPKLFLVLLLAYVLAGLTGCTWPPRPTQEMPVAIPAPVAPPRPALAVQNLKPTDPPAVVLQAYVASLHQCVGYADELEIIFVKSEKKPK